jgi:hypothetical protein
VGRLDIFDALAEPIISQGERAACTSPAASTVQVARRQYLARR